MVSTGWVLTASSFRVLRPSLKASWGAVKKGRALFLLCRWGKQREEG